MIRKFRPFFTRKTILSTSIGSALFFMLMGIIFWGGFNTAMEETNTLNFCISCHEMKDNVYQEYKTTIHYKNRTGVRATCPDCHVPRPWIHKVTRKIEASNELAHKILGSIDSPEKFNKKRLKMAQHVWKSMQQTDSRECRNCHSFEAMDMSRQQSRSNQVHTHSKHRGKTCIDCHKGIAHKLPENITPYKGGDDEDHQYYEELKIPCYKCHSDMQKAEDEDWD